MTCIFCSIAAGSAAAYVIYSDADTLGFLDRSPATRGHVLIIPREHTDDIWSISADTFNSVARATHSVAGLLRERLHPDGITLFQANRHSGWQDVFHLHMHVVPRYASDRLVRPWSTSAPDQAELDVVATELGGGLVS